jgi:hypothetical protein
MWRSSAVTAGEACPRGCTTITFQVGAFWANRRAIPGARRRRGDTAHPLQGWEPNTPERAAVGRNRWSGYVCIQGCEHGQGALVQMVILLGCRVGVDRPCAIFPSSSTGCSPTRGLRSRGSVVQGNEGEWCQGKKAALTREKIMSLKAVMGAVHRRGTSGRRRARG